MCTSGSRQRGSCKPETAPGARTTTGMSSVMCVSRSRWDVVEMAGLGICVASGMSGVSAKGSSSFAPEA